jgi:zeaxanthin glucosyltransferase
LTVACNALPVHFQPDVPVHSETWPPSTGRLSRFRNRMVQHVVVGLGKPFLNRIRRTRLARGLGWNVWHHLNEIPPSLAQVAQLPACLDFPRRHAPDHFHHTGPWHELKATSGDGFDWSWLDGRPLIYASLGTLQNGLDQLYQLILDACRDLPMQVVLTLGRSDGHLPSRIPANAQVLGYGPQLALLKRASLVITHAGMNTTLESLTQGLPMVALPIANEQPGIAARIRHAGVGDWLPVRGLTPTKLRGAVEKVHTHARYRERATECARQIAKDGGLSRAAEIIERAVVERRRVTKW